MNIVAETGSEVYGEALKYLHENGVKVGKFVECLDLNIQITDPNRAEPLSNKTFWAWALVEALERVCPFYKNPGVAWLLRPNWKRKLEKEGGTFDYTYREAIQPQLPTILQLLRKSLEREAVLAVWEPYYLLDRSSFHRVPCTLYIHFYISGGQLNCFVTMRSVDLINLGSFDLFHHSFLQRYVAAKLGVPLGSLYFRATHFYMHQKRHKPEKLEREQAALQERRYTPTPLTAHNLDEDIECAYAEIVQVLKFPALHNINPEKAFGTNNIYQPLIKHMRDAILHKLGVIQLENLSHHFHTLLRNK